MAHSVTTVAFDKTGTLTEGKPSLVAVEAGLDAQVGQVLTLAAGLQQGSDHPPARMRSWKARPTASPCPRRRPRVAGPRRGAALVDDQRLLSAARGS